MRITTRPGIRRRTAILFLATVLAVLLAGCTTPDPRPTAECLPEFLEGIPADRVTTAEYGASDLVLLAADQSKDEAFALVVTRNRIPVLALRLNFFANGEIFKIESAIDESCRRVRRWEVVGRPDETILQNWDTVIFRSDGMEIPVRLGYHGSGRIETDLSQPE